jgi:outer membrane immunogenic protein
VHYSVEWFVRRVSIMGERVMKRLFAASFVGLAFCITSLSGLARAADLAPMLKAAPGASWTGFYVDGGIGYGLWAADTATISPATGGCVLCVIQTQGGKGWLGRVGAGFDYQMTQHIVAGVLADGDFSSVKGNITDQTAGFAGSINENWTWAAGLRGGWLITPRVLSYIDAGFTQTHFNSAQMVFAGSGAATGFSTPAYTANGWFLGGGVDTPLDFILPGGWFMRTEYRFSQFGSQNLTDTCAAGCALASPQNTITFHPQVQTVTTEIVYRFNFK